MHSKSPQQGLEQHVTRNMRAVQTYQDNFRNLQTGWDNLTLLGQLAGTGIDTGSIRGAFQQLTGQLLDQLAQETLSKVVLESRAKAQVAIDILVRNLFERTADIGFLATDQDIRDYLGTSAELKQQFHARKELQQRSDALRARFAEYVSKYSVYHDVVLLDPAGNVLLRLDESIGAARSNHPLVTDALATTAPYIECFGSIDLLPGTPAALIYASRVENSAGEAIGVLCLCFRFEDEMRRIFSNLGHSKDWSVICLLDAAGGVIASSDAHHIPVGARFDIALDADYLIQRFGPGEYIATTTRPAGYQGYLGPGWFGHVMIPLQHAFEDQGNDSLERIDTQALQTVMRSSSLFSEGLRKIPGQAERIVHNLNLSIWNGHISMSRQQHSSNPAFLRVLLQEVGQAGTRTKKLFEESIADLNETVVSSILHDSAFLAALSIDIMDRNLYERANDCRWWALTSAFRSALATDTVSDETAEQCADILRYINRLYTVYSQLVLFDSRGRIIATSRQGTRDAGQLLDEEWVPRTLSIDNSQGYVVSQFAPTALYNNAATYIYAAAIRAPDGSRVVGGIGIVFDATPQFQAMLQDSLPRNEQGAPEQGCFGVFIDSSGRVIGSTHESLPPGSHFVPDRQLCAHSTESRFGITEWQGRVHAIGIRGSSGYREYKSAEDCYHSDIQSIIMIPICEGIAQQDAVAPEALRVHSDRSAADLIELATLRIGNRWVAVKPGEIAEALSLPELAGVPGAGSDFAGFLMHNGVPVPIFDVYGLVHDAQAPAHKRGQQIVLLRHGEASLLGILADELGSILELPATRQRHVPEIIAGASVITEAIIPLGEGEDLLPILSGERIARRLGANQPQRPASGNPSLRVATRIHGT